MKTFIAPRQTRTCCLAEAWTTTDWLPVAHPGGVEDGTLAGASRGDGIKSHTWTQRGGENRYPGEARYLAEETALMIGGTTIQQRYSRKAPRWW